MAKRFTDTNKYKKPFIRGLQGAYKLLWDYLYHDCDHAGIWIVDFDVAQIYIGSDMPVNKTDALKNFNTDEPRILEIDGGKKWFIPSFIKFQYGELNEENRAHKSVITLLKNNNIILDDKGLISPLKQAKDKDKDKVKNKDKGKDIVERQKEFAETLKPYIETYGREMVLEFYDYWREKNTNKTRMKFEIQKTWDVELRLKKWNDNKDKFEGNGQRTRKTGHDFSDIEGAAREVLRGNKGNGDSGMPEG